MKSRFFFPALLAGAASLPVQAAPAPAGGLSFNMTARISATGKNSMPPQVVQARVLLSGQKARIETQSSGARAVVLYSPPFVYRLLPDSRAGVKWKLARGAAQNFGGFDPQQLLRNPSQIRAALLANGAKRVAISKLGGVPVEVFEVSRPGQRFSKAKAWLRVADALPLRLEAKASGLSHVASWSRYARMKSVSPSQFAPPKGFAIRESQNPPMLSIL